MSNVIYGLDLCSGAGGATRGYIDAAERFGIKLIMTGVDHRPMPRYLKSGGTEFLQIDALRVLESRSFMSQFHFVHCSPPCQLFSPTKRLHGNKGHVDLLTPMRPWMQIYSDIPWIIENVPQAPLIDPVQLCGSMFPDLHGNDPRRQLRRHRNFECRGFDVPQMPHQHNGFRPLGVYGVAGKPVPRGGDIAVDLAEGNKLMGIDWMLWSELREAIPPAYTEHIGMHLFKEIAA